MSKELVNEAVIAAIQKVGVFLLQVCSGFAVKMILGSDGKSNWKQKLGKFIIACYAGYLMDKVCTNFGWESWRGVAVTITALLSEGLIKFIFISILKIINAPRYGDMLEAFLKKKLNIELPPRNHNSNDENKKP